MSQYAKMLYRYIAELNLDLNDDQVAQIRVRIEAGKMSEMQAKAWLRALEPVIQHAIDFPDVTHRLPDDEDLNADGGPDVEIGNLANGLRFGIRFLDRPRHILITGSTGAAKSSCVRHLIEEIDRQCDDVQSSSST